MRVMVIATLQLIAGVGLCLGQAPGDVVLSPAALGSPITLEDGPDYTNFLDCAAKALHPDFRHGDNRSALENPLKKSAPSQTAVIAGHGHSGKICTSNGIDCVLPQESINANNHASWQPWAGAWTGKFKSLTVLACDTGEGQDGLQLLKLLATSSNMPVRAPANFIWCGPHQGSDQIVMDKDARWQEVTPSGNPSAIPFEARIYPLMSPESQMQIGVDKALEKLPFSAARLDAFTALGDAQPVFREQSPAQVESLIARIDFTQPLVTSYVPDAEVTARFEFSIAYNNRSLRKRFVVLNDRLVNDVDDRRLYYHTSSTFTEQLQALRRR